ncbi:MAG: hypothetical protein HY581_11245 [Nitrospirae bacterium]|nr:hypothetical protein [Nitrospirota bacterium]
MVRMTSGMLAFLVASLGFFSIWLGGIVGQPGVPGPAFAAESLNVEGLPADPKAFRAQVDQILKKTDGLIGKLKDNKNAEAALLDLIQTRDNVLREIFKVENRPDGSKWTAKEARESVEAMLKLLKAHYEKAAGIGG